MSAIAVAKSLAAADALKKALREQEVMFGDGSKQVITSMLLAHVKFLRQLLEELAVPPDLEVGP